MSETVILVLDFGNLENPKLSEEGERAGSMSPFSSCVRVATKRMDLGMRGSSRDHARFGWLVFHQALSLGADKNGISICSAGGTGNADHLALPPFHHEDAGVGIP